MKKMIWLVSAITLVACSNGAPIADTTLAIEAMDALSDDIMQGRRVGTDGGARARAYLVELTTRLNQGNAPDVIAFEREIIRRDEAFTISGQNIVAHIPGRSESAQANTGPILDITAHYDHVGTRDGDVFNGADDNASGVGAVLSILKSFHETPPENDINLVFFDGEEFGLSGARAYVETLDNRPRLNMNLDMISQNEDGIIYASGTYHYPELKPLIEKAAQSTDMEVYFGHDRPEDGSDDWTLMSDHGPFHQRGIPFVYFGVEDHVHYHQPTDEFETIPLDVYRESVQLMVNTAHRLDDNLSDLAKVPSTGP